MSKFTLEYQEFLKQIYKRAKKDREEIMKKSKFNNPILQTESCYITKKPKRSRLAEEYNAKFSEKKEKIHRKVHPIETDIFHTKTDNSKNEKKKNMRAYLREQQEINSKKEKPKGIKTFYQGDRI